MATRRIHNTREATAARASALPRRRSSTGITRSLLTMVASAMLATITMPVAAENPPTYATSASTVLPWLSGSASTTASSTTALPLPNNAMPAEAIGTTIAEMITR